MGPGPSGRRAAALQLRLGHQGDRIRPCLRIGLHVRQPGCVHPRQTAPQDLSGLIGPLQHTDGAVPPRNERKHAPDLLRRHCIGACRAGTAPNREIRPRGEYVQR
eukprot:scaffold114222_cov63-Phaeocystis_antarctica.AAC.4